MSVQIVITLREDVGLQVADSFVSLLESQFGNNVTGGTLSGATFEMRKLDEDATVVATRQEAIGHVTFDGIVYGVEISKDDERRTNIKFTSDPPFSKTYARVIYEWTGRLEKDR